MKKVIFVLPHMLCGGVEKALLSLINEMPKDEYCISILLAEQQGEFLNQIPERISISTIDAPRNAYVVEGTKAALKKYLVNGKIIKFFKVCRNIITGADITTLTVKFDKLPMVEEKYDVAICFHVHMPLLIKYVLYKINATKKIAWVHNDFYSAKFNVEKYSKYIEKYDHVFCVSHQLKEELINVIPTIKDKVSVAPNVISKSYINQMLSMAKTKNCYPNSGVGIKILTIGRLESQKGYDLALDVCRMLKNEGYDFCWFVLGEGSLKNKIENTIKKYGIQNNFVLLGIRTNPYPYIKECDIYVQPSRHEGYGIAVAEARSLNKPIVCTDFTGARDQIVDGQTGIIVPTDVHAIKDALETLIKSKTLRDQLSQNLAKTDCDTVKTVEKVLSYF